MVEEVSRKQVETEENIDRALTKVEERLCEIRQQQLHTARIHAQLGI